MAGWRILGHGGGSHPAVDEAHGVRGDQGRAAPGLEEQEMHLLWPLNLLGLVAVDQGT